MRSKNCPAAACYCLVLEKFTIVGNMESEVSTKKSKKAKINKKTKNIYDVTEKEDNKEIARKQRELMRVLHVKNFQLQNGNLSYLDYVELKEELLRLNALKDVFNTMSTALE